MTLISPSCPVIISVCFLSLYSLTNLLSVPTTTPSFHQFALQFLHSVFLFNLWCCLAASITTAVWSLWSNSFLLFYLNCSITMLLWVLSLQIWVNTNATRSVSVSITLWGRVPAVHHRKCLLERRVCFFSHCAACVLVYLPFNLVKQVIWNIKKVSLLHSAPF